MAGHSKWSKIRHKKALNDAKKGKVFSKLAKQISVAARDGGSDPDANITLRLLMDKAKSAGMPAENVSRAVARGSGEGGEGSVLESVTYEGYGPGGISFMVGTLTDNKNRTVAEIRNFLNGHGASLADAGAVSWNFEQRGLVTMRPAKMQSSQKYGEADFAVEEDSEAVMLEMMEVEGVVDIKEYADVADVDSEVEVKFFDLYTDPKALGAVRDRVRELGYIVTEAELVWVAKMAKELSEAEVDKAAGFLSELEDVEDVQHVWSDLVVTE